MKQNQILVINPGSTSTKISLFNDQDELFTQTINHVAEELQGFTKIIDQFELRKGLILKLLDANNIDIGTLSAVIGRGGLVRPIRSGVYEVNEALKIDLRNAPQGEHASNLGGLLAAEIADMAQTAQTASTKKNVKAYIADPVVVDELDDVARISGHPLFFRASIFHALNQKAVARIFAKDKGKKYSELNLIIAHLGGGISVGAHRNGRVVDVNNALDGEGPFSPERSGTLPSGQLVELCFSGEYTISEVRKMINGRGGLTALAGTNDLRKVLKEAEAGNARAALLIEAMAYNVAKSVGEMATVLWGKVDAIILTGGIAHSKLICELIERRVSFIAPVRVIPGEDEMQALAVNALDVLKGEVDPSIY